MSSPAPFTLKNRNPDVLTCIANLSNDEVFTPPELANKMLDRLAVAWADANGGANIWENSEVTFLDPFTKSGVFLREVVERLTEGLAVDIPDLEERVNHILKNQVFGIAITHLTSLLARRSVYCSKAANGDHSIGKAVFEDEVGNIWFESLQHSWVGGRTIKVVSSSKRARAPRVVDRKCEFCGVGENALHREEGLETHAYAFIHNRDIQVFTKEIFGGKMQFDVIIGNPPYQLNDGGGSGSSAMPIYQKFVEQAKNLSPRFVSMVIPARWYSGGKGLDAFRKDMLNDKRVRRLVDFPDSRDVFGGVDIAGGVCYFVWDRDNEGKCRVETVIGQDSFSNERWLGESDVFVRDNRALEVIEKVRSKADGWLSEKVSPRNPFNIDDVSPGGRGEVLVFSSKGDGRISLSKVGRNHAWVDTWKVLLSKTTSEHAGQTDKTGRRRVFSRIELMEPGTACTGSYLVVGPFESEMQARNAATYLRTRFVRFLASTVLLTQNITRSAFQFVPAVSLDIQWTDQELYKIFGLNHSEIAFIESTIREMDSIDE